MLGLDKFARKLVAEMVATADKIVTTGGIGTHESRQTVAIMLHTLAGIIRKVAELD